MTGYLYQCELALLELAERSWDDITVEVRMEVLDDIEFLYQDSGDPSVLLQSKHRERAGRLSETGKDFWRSVASWIDALTVLGRLSDGTMRCCGWSPPRWQPKAPSSTSSAPGPSAPSTTPWPAWKRSRERPSPATPRTTARSSPTSPPHSATDWSPPWRSAMRRR